MSTRTRPRTPLCMRPAALVLLAFLVVVGVSCSSGADQTAIDATDPIAQDRTSEAETSEAETSQAETNGSDVGSSTSNSQVYEENGLTVSHPSTWKLADEIWGLWSFGTATVFFDVGDDGLVIVQLFEREPGEALNDPIDALPWETDERVDRPEPISGFRVSEASASPEMLGERVDWRAISGVQLIDGYEVAVQLQSPSDEFESHKAGFFEMLDSLAFEAPS